MSKVIFDISMSLDGFSAAGNPRPREPTRDGGQVLWGAGDGRRRSRSQVPRRPIAVEVADAIPRTPAATHVRVVIARGTAACLLRRGHELRRRVVATSWEPVQVQREVGMIVDELHCSSLLVLGSELKRVALVVPLALERVLRVTVRPRLIDGPPTAGLAAFDAADLAEALRRAHDDVVPYVGCELSLFAPGTSPARGYTTASVRGWPVARRALTSTRA